MSDIAFAEGIYVKRSKSKFGSGVTSRERDLETFWFPHRAQNGYVELFLVTDNLERVLGIKERVPVELFKKEYSVKDNGRDIYLKLIKTVPQQ